MCEHSCGLEKSYDRWQSKRELLKITNLVALWHIPEIAADPSYRAKRERGVSLYALRDKNANDTKKRDALLVTHKAAAAAAHNK